jgi:hypothetical protein
MNGVDYLLARYPNRAVHSQRAGDNVQIELGLKALLVPCVERRPEFGHVERGYLIILKPGRQSF